MPDNPNPIEARTQAILEQQIGNLVIVCARLRAECEARRAAAAAERSGSPDGARSADGPGTEVGHG